MGKQFSIIAGAEIASRYDGATLREIRKANGVGRPPFPGEWDSWSRGAQADQVNQMADKKQPRSACIAFPNGHQTP